MYGKYERGILYVILYFIYWSQKIFFRNQFLSIIQVAKNKLGLPTITCLSGVGEQLLIFIIQTGPAALTPNPNQSQKSTMLVYLVYMAYILYSCLYLFMIQITREQQQPTKPQLGINHCSETKFYILLHQYVLWFCH